MAKFEIKRSTFQPSGQGPNVLLNIDTDTGAGAIGRGLQQAGGQLIQIGEKIRLAEDSSESDKLQRQEQEDWILLQANQNINQAPKERAAAFEAHKKKWDIEQGSNRRVRASYERYRNNVMPKRFGEFTRADLSIRTQVLRKDFDSTLNGFYKMYDADNPLTEEVKFNAEVHINKGVKLEVLTKKQGQTLIDSFEAQSSLVRGQDEILSGDPVKVAAGVERLEKARKTGGLSTLQLKFVRDNIKQGRSILKDSGLTVVDNIMIEKFKNRDKPASERRAIADGLILELITTPGISPSEKRIGQDRLDAWANGKDIVSKPGLKADLTDKVLRRSTLGLDILPVANEVKENATRLSDNDYDALRKLVTAELNKTQLRAINDSLNSDEDLVGKFKDPVLRARRQQQLIDFITENPQASRKDIFVASEGFRKTDENRDFDAGIGDDVLLQAVEDVFAEPETGRPFPTATNPNTGEVVIFKDGKWQPR